MMGAPFGVARGRRERIGSDAMTTRVADTGYGPAGVLRQR
jgi:hypothetical protein